MPTLPTLNSREILDFLETKVQISYFRPNEVKQRFPVSFSLFTL